MTKIHKIKMKTEYKSIPEDFEDFILSDFTVITGENNSGKTNFVEAVDKGKVKFFDDEGNEITDVEVLYIPAEYVEGNEKLKVGKTSKVVEVIADFLKENFDTNIIDSVNTEKITRISSLVNQRVNKIMNDGNTENSIGISIKDNIDIKDILNIALNVFPEKDRIHGTEHKKFEELGLGIQRIIIATFLLVIAEEKMESDKTNLVLIEEPEVYLHPRLKKSLNNTLKTIASESGYQVIITTHDPYFAYSNLNNKKGSIYSFSRKREDGKTQFENKNIISGVEDELLHIILFSKVLAKAVEDSISIESLRQDSNLDNYIKEKGENEVKEYYWEERDGRETPCPNMSLPLYIRHCLHHPENKFTVEEKNKIDEGELEKSIEILNKILSN